MRDNLGYESAAYRASECDRIRAERAETMAMGLVLIAVLAMLATVVLYVRVQG